MGYKVWKPERWGIYIAPVTNTAFFVQQTSQIQNLTCVKKKIYMASFSHTPISVILEC
jgi:hypothetical protein